jgi:hypothetical protein
MAATDDLFERMRLSLEAEATRIMEEKKDEIFGAARFIEEHQLHTAIDKHFEELHSTLWGQPFYLIGEGGAAADSRKKAVAWMAEEMESILANLGFMVNKPDPNQIELELELEE